MISTPSLLNFLPLLGPDHGPLLIPGTSTDTGLVGLVFPKSSSGSSTPRTIHPCPRDLVLDALDKLIDESFDSLESVDMTSKDSTTSHNQSLSLNPNPPQYSSDNKSFQFQLSISSHCTSISKLPNTLSKIQEQSPFNSSSLLPNNESSFYKEQEASICIKQSTLHSDFTIPHNSILPPLRPAQGHALQNSLADFTISTAKAKDISMIQQFTTQILKTQFSQSFFLQYMYKSNHFLLTMRRQLTQSKYEIIGVIAGHLLPNTKSSKSSWFSTISAYVSILAVDPEYRRMGVASKLLHELESKLVSSAFNYGYTSPSSSSSSNYCLGYSSLNDNKLSIPETNELILDSLILDVEESNFTAQKFYEKHGFYKSSNLKRGYYKNTGKNSIEMKKVLIG